jgi:hypothetical protein
MKIERKIFKHHCKNKYAGYIAILWVTEAANITVAPLITAYKGDMEDKLEKIEASAMNKDDMIEKFMVSIP